MVISFNRFSEGLRGGQFVGSFEQRDTIVL